MSTADELDASVDVIGIFDSDGRQYTPGEIDMPSLCRSCVHRPPEGLTGVLCQLSWLDQMLTPEDEREAFSCHAYENS